MSKKRIVIISRTIFPMQAPRSHRATELAIELARRGHDVTLYAVLGKYDYESFEKKNNLKVRNLGSMHFATLNSDGESNRNIFIKIASRLLNKLIEFPDVELVSKIKNVLYNEIDIDVLITVAVPFPLHWGAALAKMCDKDKFAKTWIADCGDPYMGNKFKTHLFYFKYVEKWFMKRTDFITIPIEGAREGYYKEFQSKIRIIPQGFNFKEINIKQEPSFNKVPTFIYAGAFYKDIRDPELFLEYLCTLDVDFKFIIFTKHGNLIEPYMARLADRIELRSYIPRLELLNEMSKADFLINFENGTNIQSPSKLIDYALVNKPILSIKSEILEKSNINDFLAGKYNSRMIIKNLEQYNIVNVADQFLNLASNGAD